MHDRPVLEFGGGDRIWGRQCASGGDEHSLSILYPDYDTGQSQLGSLCVRIVWSNFRFGFAK